MATDTRNRRLCWAAVVGAAVLLALGAFLVHHRPRSAQLTPAGPSVDSLREAVAAANIVIVVLDATRADHVGCYGYPRATTPSIDSLAQQSVLFESHFSQTAETKSSTTCLLTSEYADTHLSDGPRSLVPGTFTMQEGLREAGFRTALFSSNLKACPLYGVGDDFQDSFWDKQLEAFTSEGQKRYHPSVLLKAFETWLGEHSQERFFAYLHFIPPHYPYEQPEQFTDLFAALGPVDFEPGQVPYPEHLPPPVPVPPPLPEWINLYDANLRYGDWALGETIRLLQEHNAFSNTVFILTSDHGEGFGEHGHVWHGRSVYDEACHIPLLVRFPGERLAGKRLPALTQSIDLLPTLFDLCGLPYPAQGIQGRSFLPLLAGNVASVHDHVFCRGGGRPSKYLVRSPTQALVLYSDGEHRALYDLELDPRQRTNISSDNLPVVEEMTEVFRRFAEQQRRPPRDFLDPNAKMPPLPDVPEIKLSPEDRARVERIADLGYVR